jgi:predicted hydrocarbon binding protein
MMSHRSEKTHSGFEKRVNVLLFSNERRFFEICMALQNVTGSLSTVVDTLTRAGFNILSCELTNGVHGSLGTLTVFMEVPSEQVTVEGTKASLTSLSVVKDVSIAESTNGLIIDSLRFPFEFASGERALIIRREAMLQMTATMMAKFGSGGEVILFELGKAAGKKDGRDLDELMGRENVVANLPQISKLYSALGWGRSSMKSQEPDPSHFVIRITDCFESNRELKSERPTCSFVRGHMAGFVSEIFRREFVAREVACESKGDDFCEFVITGSA